MNDRFQSIIGHKLPLSLLRASLKKDRIAPAYLFLGADGIGKTLTAIAFVESLLDRSIVNHPDVLYLEPTYQEKGKLLTISEAQATGNIPKGKAQIRIEQIRAIGEFLAHPPLNGKRSIVIMTEAQTMAETSANALLKTLEEPGKATILLISCQRPMATILSRCQVIPFAPLSQAEVGQILSQQGYSSIPPSLLRLSPKNAITAWETLQNIPPDLLQTLENLPLSLVPALTIAKRITQELDIQTQLWLIDYLQDQQWQTKRQTKILHNLEQAKQWLQGFVSPRLVWEVTLAMN